MTCEEMMDLMQRSLDLDLTAAEEQAMLAHLEKCPDCSDLYVRLKLLSEELAQLPKVKPAYSIVDAILPQLESMPDWNTAETSADTGTAAALDQAPSTTKVVPIAERRGLINWKIFTGVAAAGIALGMFIFNGDGSRWDKTASENASMSGLAISSPESAAGAAPQGLATGQSMKKDVTAAVPPLEGSSAGEELKVQITSTPDAKASTKAKEDTLTDKMSIARDSREVTMASPQDLAPSAVQDQYGITPKSGQADQNTAAAGNGIDGEGHLQSQEKLNISLVAPTPLPETAGSGEASLTFTQHNDEKAAADDAKQGNEAPEANSKMLENNTLHGFAPAIAAITPISSPDGVYTASLVDHSVTITGKDGSVVFTSANRMNPGDQLVFKEWADGYLFTYSLTSPDGTETVYKISAAEKKEWSQ
jgi:hypothetical protein